MSLAFRLIARLDVKAPALIKTVQLEGVRKLGDPNEFARRYDTSGIDEILYLDAVASLYGRNSLGALVRETTADIFTPVTVGGGIRSVEDSRGLLLAGADKVAVNTAAHARPNLINALAAKLGSQSVVIQIDAKGGYCRTDGGRQETNRQVADWAKEAAEQGAGEILLTSIDREGTKKGCDLDLIESVTRSVTIPVVASGGFGEPAHAVQAAQAGASGIAISGALHYNTVQLDEIRDALVGAGVAVRKAAA